MTKIKSSDLRKCCEAMEHDGIRYYGEYSGRYFFKGFGVLIDTPARLMPFTRDLLEYAEDHDLPELRQLASGYHHADSMGVSDMLIAWGEELFEKDEDYEPDEDEDE